MNGDVRTELEELLDLVDTRTLLRRAILGGYDTYEDYQRYGDIFPRIKLMVKAKDVPEGRCFRKVTGEYVYLRLSDSSVRHLGLDESEVYGICYNGNVTVMQPDKDVVLMPMRAMLGNLEAEYAWEDTIGVKHTSEEKALRRLEELDG